MARKIYAYIKLDGLKDKFYIYSTATLVAIAGPFDSHVEARNYFYANNISNKFELA